MGYFANAQYDVLFLLHVILNAVKNPTEEVRRSCFGTLVVGYFACAQYDVLFLLHVILNEVKNPTEEVRRLCFGTLVVGYFACAQYDVLLSPIGTSCHFPRRRKQELSLRAERSNLPGGWFSVKHIYLT